MKERQTSCKVSSCQCDGFGLLSDHEDGLLFRQRDISSYLPAARLGSFRLSETLISLSVEVRGQGTVTSFKSKISGTASFTVPASFFILSVSNRVIFTLLFIDY